MTSSGGGNERMRIICVAFRHSFHHSRPAFSLGDGLYGHGISFRIKRLLVQILVQTTVTFSLSLDYCFCRKKTTQPMCYLCIYVSIYVCMYLSIYLSICLSVCLFVRPSVRPSIHPSIHLSIYLSIDRSIYLSVKHAEAINKAKLDERIYL